MHIKLNKVTIHNFLSIGDITLELADQGYVLVEGHNNNSADGALSNGSGKSSLWNAICWALTGETIQGLKTNIANIHGEDGCFVCLELTVDGSEYKITRYREYDKIKNDLKIEINGEDRSGKGLRESTELLAQYLPEITSDLIGNVIILGQGLPHKFSNNTPAGRKELLENLSHSDFMIQDIKDRLTERMDLLNDKLRRQEDERLKLEVTQSANDKNIESITMQLNSLDTSEHLKEAIAKWTQEEQVIGKEYDQLSREVAECNTQVDELKDKHQAVSVELMSTRNQISEKWNGRILEKKSQLIESQTMARTLTSEITKLESITDVCPTCGQKLPDVHKPDISKQREELEVLKNNIESLSKEVTSLSESMNAEQANAQKELNGTLVTLQGEINFCTSQLGQLKTQQQTASTKLASAQQYKKEFQTKLDSLEQTRQMLEEHIATLQDENTKLADRILYNKKGIEDTQEHIDVINKINSLVKRDFRGILLTNVIDFLDAKIKLYSSYVFNTQNVKLFLEGNNVNIEYCGKAYENLSGGEKQRMDIIIQMAIRDMMCQYLDFSANILVIDECFDGLDAVGCEKILDLISTCVTDVESLFIISHHSESLQIPADKILVVEKNEEGISRLVK